MKKTLFSLLALSISIAQGEEGKESPATPAPAPAAEQPAATPAEAPADDTAKQETPAATAEQPAATTEQPAQETPAQQEQRKVDEKAKDATLRLREKMTTMDTELAKITKPTRSLVSRVNSVKTRITRQLEDMDRRALKIAQLQTEFNEAKGADFTFDKISVDERDRYMRDGQAAYKAMLVDMKQKKGARKVGGLDKYEIMRKRYQGIPEYKDAHARYLRTLRKLDKNWSARLTQEQNVRKRYTPAKVKAASDMDKRQYDELVRKLQEEGEDIAKVWVIPNMRNIKMLDYCIRKVRDVLKRTERETLDPAVGTVPALINQYWEKMDDIRQSMINGELEDAEAKIKNNAALDLIMRLRKELLPDEYRIPIREQNQATRDEITKRLRNYQRLQRTLENEIATLTRITTSAEAQIDGAMDAVQEALDSDIGENSMEVDQPAPPAPAQPEQPAQPAEGEAKPVEAEQPAEAAAPEQKPAA